MPDHVLIRSWFEDWHRPEAFAAAIERASPDDHRTNKAKFWREAWIASQFIERTGQKNAQVRLTPESSPFGDFELRDVLGTHVFEVTEAVDENMVKKSRRESGPIFCSQEDISGEMALRKIPELIAMKSKKDYSADVGLIIYVDLWARFQDATSLVPVCGRSFKSIWLLVGRQAIPIWRRDPEFAA